MQHCSGQPVEATSKIVLAPNRHVSRTQGLHGEQGQSGSAGRAGTPIQTQTSRSRHSKARSEALPDQVYFPCLAGNFCNGDQAMAMVQLAIFL